MRILAENHQMCLERADSTVGQASGLLRDKPEACPTLSE